MPAGECVQNVSLLKTFIARTTRGASCLFLYPPAPAFAVSIFRMFFCVVGWHVVFFFLNPDNADAGEVGLMDTVRHLLPHE